MKSAAFIWVCFVAGFVLLWQCVIWGQVVSPAAIASPSEVLLSIPIVLSTSGNLLDVASTAWYSMAAFLFSVPIGIVGGVCVFYAGRVNDPAIFTLDFLRSIPATALVPVFLIIVGVNDGTKVVIGAFSSSLVICLATITGLHGRNTTRIGVAKLLGISGTRKLLLLDLPEAAPHIFLGLRTGISLAFVLVVVTEMLIGSNRGLGKVIADMRYTDDKGRLFAAILVAGVIGYLFNLLLRTLERRLIHWRGA